MRFAIDEIALGLSLGILLILGFFKIFLFPTSGSPSLGFSKVKELRFASWRSRFASFPSKLHLMSLLFLFLAFMDPHLLIPKTPLSKQSNKNSESPSEGLAIYLLLDQSGSMVQSVNSSGQSLPKIELLKKVTKQFIEDHSSDLIGLISFARVPKVLVPLTLDQDTLLSQLKQIQVVKKPEEDGTAIGYAIYKAAHLIVATRHFANEQMQDEKPPYTIKSAVLIVVTDGFQDPSHLDKGNLARSMELDDAANYAKSQNIRLYVINIDPSLATSQYAPQRRQLQSVTAMTGGKFYLVNDQQELHDIYVTIDHLEKGTISKQIQESLNPRAAFTRFSFYHFFIAFGLMCLLMALFLDFFVLKVVP